MSIQVKRRARGQSQPILQLLQIPSNMQPQQALHEMQPMREHLRPPLQVREQLCRSIQLRYIHQANNLTRAIRVHIFHKFQSIHSSAKPKPVINPHSSIFHPIQKFSSDGFERVLNIVSLFYIKKKPDNI